MTYITPRPARPLDCRPKPAQPPRPDRSTEILRAASHMLKDRDGDKRLSSREFGPGKRSQLEFAERDKNADGLLDRSESTPPRHEVAKDLDPATGYQLLDANGDYVLTADEFGQGQEHQARFAAYDRNDDGWVTLSEHDRGRSQEQLQAASYPMPTEIPGLSYGP